MKAVHVVLPAGIDDPRRPSGGNVYDRRVCNGLVGLGWDVRERHVAGSWPYPDSNALAGLADAIAAVPDEGVVLVDGLVASAARDVLVPATRQLRLVVLVHLPLRLPGEGAVLAAARAVITTSGWGRNQLIGWYPLAPQAVHVAEPGADRAARASGTPGGGELLCVAPVSSHKGHDLLLSALAAVRDLPWRCRCVGSLERNPAFVEQVRRQVVSNGLAGRVTFCGTRTGAELAHAYATADVLVHASRGETYGMVITEALARALPVLATEVGGVPEALGDTPAGKAGRLVAPDEAGGLAAALRRWLTDERWRARLREAAAHRRQTLPAWKETAHRIADALTEAMA